MGLPAELFGGRGAGEVAESLRCCGRFSPCRWQTRADLCIDMRFRVNDLSALRLPRVDVTIVLGNLIDNAMEACAGLSDPNRWVSIQILYSENMLSILIINPSNVVQIHDGHIPTTKQDPLLHGFGIGNVKDILEKYHAEYLFTYDDGRFIFSADWPDISESPVNTSILS